MLDGQYQDLNFLDGNMSVPVMNTLVMQFIPSLMM